MIKNFKLILFSVVLTIFVPQFMLFQVKPSISSQSSTEATIRKTAISFLQAAVKGDRETLYKLSAKGSEDELPLVRRIIERSWEKPTPFSAENPRFSRIKIRASEASLRITIQFQRNVDPENPFVPFSFDFKFQKIGKEWKISLADSSAKLFALVFLSAKGVSEEQKLIEKEGDLLATEGLYVLDYYLKRANNGEEENPRFLRLLTTVHKRSDDYKMKTEVTWYLGESFARKKDYENAIEFYQTGLNIARLLDYDYAQGINLTGLSEVYVYLGDNAKGEQFLTEAITVFSKKPKLIRVASWARSKVGDAFFNTEAYETALKLYKQAYDLGVSQNDKYRQANSLNNIGACYFRMKNFSEAQTSFEKALAIILAEENNLLVPFNNSKGLAVWDLYTSQGEIHQAQDQFEQAIEMYQKAIGLALANKSAKGLATSYRALARHQNEPQARQTYQTLFNKLIDLKDGSELAKSLTDVVGEIFYSGGITEAEKLLSEWSEKGSILFTDEDLVELWVTKGLIESMKGEWRQAETSFRKIIESPGSTPFDKSVASLLISQLYRSQGQRDESLKYLEQAEMWGKQILQWDRVKWNKINSAIQMQKIPLLIFKYGIDKEESLRILAEIANENKADELIVAMSFLYQGVVYLSSIDEEKVDVPQDDFKKGIESLEKSLKYVDSTGIEFKELALQAWTYLGIFYYLSKDYEKALNCIGKAKSFATQLYSNQSVSYLNAVEGAIYADTKQWTNARTSLNSAITEFEKNTSNVMGGVLGRLKTTAFNHDFYQMMVRTLLELGEKENALIYTEKAKGRILLEFASRKNQANTKFDLAQMVNDVKKISRNSNQKFFLGKQNFTTSDFSFLKETENLKSTVLTSQRIKDLLPNPQTAFVQYFVDEKEIYLFVLATNSEETNEKNWRNKLEWKVFKIENSSIIESDVENLQYLISNNLMDYDEYSRKVYDSLIKPAEKLLKGKSTLVIIPDGYLWSIPFQALQSNSERFLIDDYVIYYAPSLSVLSQMQEIKTNRQQKPVKKDGKDILAIGNPTFKDLILALKPITWAEMLPVSGGNNSIVKNVLVERNNKKLEPLPRAAEEAKTLSTIYGSSRVQLRVSETKKQFIQEAGKYSLLHISTHGILGDLNSMESALFFGVRPSKENIVAENQLLRAEEIMKMELNADLVILSACDTANGEVSEGEGLIAFSWAFMAAGVPTIIASQWAVDPESTEIFMKDFHQRLKISENNNGNFSNVAENLRNASLFLKNEEKLSHPYYWAAFITIGSNN